MTTESNSFQKEITAMIADFGEFLTFSRGTKKLLSAKCAFGSIKTRDVSSDGTPIQSEQRTVSIPYTKNYIPELMDAVQDKHKNIFMIQNVQTSRYQDTVICYICSIT